MKYHFYFDGKTVAMQRPRSGMYGNTYVSKDTKRCEKMIAEAFHSAHPDAELLTGALRVKVTVYRPMTKAIEKKYRRAVKKGIKWSSLDYLPSTKPDIDNQAKTILDALQGLAYKNDSQITDLHMKKRYVEYPHDTDYADIEIEEIKR